MGDRLIMTEKIAGAVNGWIGRLVFAVVLTSMLGAIGYFSVRSYEAVLTELREIKCDMNKMITLSKENRILLYYDHRGRLQYLQKKDDR